MIEDIESKILKSKLLTISKNTQLLVEQNRFINHLSNIELFVLGDPMIAMYYPDPLMCKLRDIDVLIKKGQFNEAVKRCTETGYTSFVLPTDNGDCIHFIKNNVVIHLQRRLRLFSDDKKNELLNKWIQESKPKEVKINKNVIPVPQDWIVGILQLCLIRINIEYNVISRKQLTDWISFVNSYLSKDRWPFFKQQADQLELTEIAKSVTRLGEVDASWCRDASDFFSKLKIVEESVDDDEEKAVRVSRINPIRRVLRSGFNYLQGSSIRGLLYHINDLYYIYSLKLMGKPVIQPEDVENVEKNITFIYKSFNRQRQALRLYHNIRSYYPNARIIIADDSEHPLELPEVISLPFNSGLSVGLTAALESVQTPYVMRLDDDMLLTPDTNIHKILAFLMNHQEVDLIAGMPDHKNPKECAARFAEIKMYEKLLIPAGTIIDGKEVVYKTPNCFLARTEKMRLIGYDVNLRMNEHHDFFFRAAGRMVCVLDPESSIMHCHNKFEDEKYEKYRNDTASDLRYIKNKHGSKYQIRVTNNQ